MKKNQWIKIERYRLGELPHSQENTLRQDTLQQELEELENSDREILSAYKPSEMAAAIRAKMASHPTEADSQEIAFPGPARRSRLPLLVPAAAMILFGLFIPVLINLTDSSPDREITRMKGLGEPQLKVYRELEGKTEVLEEYQSAGESDLIQLAYQITEPLYGIILSIDGRGVVTRHLPEDSPTAIPLKTGSLQLLPFSYELDDAPEYETFYLITSDIPFPVDPLIDLVAGEARDNRILMDIPSLLREKGMNREKVGNIRQYAVPIKKED